MENTGSSPKQYPTMVEVLMDAMVAAAGQAAAGTRSAESARDSIAAMSAEIERLLTEQETA
jgi:hypothetical protein